ncbi:MAG: hypothetical protein H8E46_12220 [FCB group bacterium]|nr:hypothetical protein [FCB group bacterium]
MNRKSKNIDDPRLFKAQIEENCRLNLVKAIVDSACIQIQAGALDKHQRSEFRPWVKKMVIPLIPGQEARYDMIYDSRLKRMMEQFNIEK